MVRVMNTLIFTGTLLFSELSFAATSGPLAPPEVVFRRLVQATLGADPCLRVAEPDGAKASDVAVRIDTCNEGKAQALSTLLNLPNSSSFALTVEVAGPDGRVIPPRQACEIPTMAGEAALYGAALTGNPLVANIIRADQIHVLWLEFTATVVQFDVDDISDRYGNFNLVAEDAFAQVIGLVRCGSEVKVMPTTAKVRVP